MDAGQGRARSGKGTFASVAVVAVLHMAFIVTAYATGFFHLHLAKKTVVGLWLGGSSSIALLAYLWVLLRSPLLPAEQGRLMKLAFVAITATLISLYLGIFVAYDTFGS